MKNTKKNVFTKLGIATLGAAMLSVCAVSGTYAKYTSSVAATDTARVAYWGFGQNTAKLELFKNAYAIDSGSIDGNMSVKSSQESEKVIAPGTKNECQLSFAYTSSANGAVTAPEVAYNFSVTIEVTGEYGQIDNNSSFVWTIKQGETEQATEYNSVEQFKAALQSILVSADAVDGSKTYKPGELPEFFKDSSKKLYVGWEWKFDNGNDKADTQLGSQTTLADISVEIGITATQID